MEYSLDTAHGFSVVDFAVAPSVRSSFSAMRESRFTIRPLMTTEGHVLSWSHRNPTSSILSGMESMISETMCLLVR